jgi:hypothetical protein
MLPHTSLRAAAAACAVLVSLAGAELAAAAGKPIPRDPAPFTFASPADKAKMQRQAALKEAARPITDAAERDAAANPESGYTSISLGADSVVVAWKGLPPRAVQSAIAKARGKARIELVEAEHSRAELKATADAVTQALTDGGAAEAAFSVQLSTDGSGVVVGTEGDVAETKSELPDSEAPVTVRKEDVAQATVGRLNDTAPFWGGARITSAVNGGQCSSGFSVTDGWTNYILTAGHCGHPGGGWYNGDRSRWVGTATREHVAYDLLMIPASVGPRIYDGGVNSGEFSKGVAGSDYTYAGEWLCTSGSVSGAMCGLYNDSRFFNYSYCGTDIYGYWECYSDLMVAFQKDNLVAVRPGDSGGPVFGLWGAGDVIAKGIISGRANGGTAVIFQDFWSARQAFGIRTL